MPRLYRGNGIAIHVYADHHPLHVHVYGADGRSGKIRLADGGVFASDLRAGEVRRALEWLIANEQEVWRRWRERNS